MRDSVKLVRFGQNQLSLRRRPQSRGVGGDAGSKPDTISCHCGERRNPVALVVRRPRRFTVQKIKFVIPSLAEGPALTSHRASAGKSRSLGYARDDKFRWGQCIGIARVKPTTLDSGSSPLSLPRTPQVTGNPTALYPPTSTLGKLSAHSTAWRWHGQTSIGRSERTGRISMA